MSSQYRFVDAGTIVMRHVPQFWQAYQVDLNTMIPEPSTKVSMNDPTNQHAAMLPDSQDGAMLPDSQDGAMLPNSQDGAMLPDIPTVRIMKFHVTN